MQNNILRYCTVLYFAVILLLPQSIYANVMPAQNESFNQIMAYLQKAVLEEKSKVETIGVYSVVEGTATVVEDKFLQLVSPCPVIIHNQYWFVYDYSNKFGRVQSVFVFVNTPQDVHQVLNVTDTLFLNVKIKFQFIICDAVDNFEWLSDTLQEIWNHYLLNYFVVCYKSKLEVFSYNPFFKETSRYSGFTDNKDKLKNMNGYPLKIFIFEDPPRTIRKDGVFYGRDARLLYGLIEYMNASVIIETPIENANDPYEQMYCGIWNENFDVGFVSAFQTNEAITAKVKFTYPSRRDDVVVIVHKALKIPQYKYIFLIFDTILWLSIFGSMFLVVAFESYTLYKSQTSCYNCVSQSILDTYLILLNKSITYLEKGPYSVRLLLTFWLYCSIIINVAFQCALTSIVITPKYENEINTLEELRQTDLRVTINQYHFSSIPSRVLAKDHFIIEEESVISEMLINSEDRNYAVQLSIAEEILDMERSGVHPIYHLLKEHIIPGLNGYNIKVKSPYTDVINRYILYDQQFALSKYIANRIYLKNVSLEEYVSDQVPLSLEHLQSVFYILIIGEILSILVFIMEVVIHFKLSRKNKISTIDKAITYDYVHY